MKDCYLGVDIGSISTKGVIIDDDNNIITSTYIWTEGNPTEAVKKLLNVLKKNLPKDYVIKGIGTTGSARKLIGLMLKANIVKNEITAHAIGTLTFYPNIRTILEIGGQDSKIISSQAKRLGINVEEFGDYALKSKNPVKIAARCTVFAESDLVHKAQVGYPKEDIIAGLCKSVVLNYLNNVGKGKKIIPPIIFQGGVSKNKGVVKYFKEILKEDIIVDENSHLMGAIGIAVLARRNKTGNTYSLEMSNLKFITKAFECHKCPNTCELLKIYRNDELVDSWGSKCGKY